MNRKDYWLHEGIVVKIVTKKLGEKYYKKKAVVKVLLYVTVSITCTVNSNPKHQETREMCPIVQDVEILRGYFS